MMRDQVGDVDETSTIRVGCVVFAVLIMSNGGEPLPLIVKKL